jgi:hypothetical protein
VSGIIAVYSIPTQAQKEIEVTGNSDAGQTSTLTDKVSFMRHGQSERYVWKPSSSSASNYNSQGSAFDISKVKTISRNVEYTSKLSLPENAPISASDVYILGEDDGSFSVNENGQYKTTESIIDAVNKDGKLIYSCWASEDSVERVNLANLNATETAITYMLELFPLFSDQTGNKDFLHLKNMFRELDVIKELAKAIDASIVKNGYLNRDDIDTQLDNAVEKVISLLGWEMFSESNASRITRSPTPPLNKKYYGRGMRIEIDKSDWAYSYTAKKNVWQCELTAYNYNRFGYTGIARGYIDKEGKVKLYEDGWDEYLRYIVKPQRVTSSFFDHIEFWKIENWDKIEEFYSQSYQFIVGDIELDEMTWDEEKKKEILLDFEQEGDVVVALGPRDNISVMVYNVIQLLGKPVLKKFQKKFRKLAFSNLHSELDITEYFIDKIVLDAGFISDATVIMGDSQLSKNEKFEKISEKILKKFKDYLLIEIETYLQSGAESYLWSGTGVQVLDKYVLGSADMVKLENCFDEAFAALKKIKKYGDYLLGALGLFEGNDVYYLNLDFRDPGLTIPDVDGYDM